MVSTMSALARRRRTLVVAALCWALLVCVAGPGRAQEAGADSTVLAAKALPGVQLIETTYTGTVVAAVPTVNQEAIDGAIDRIVLQVQSGVIGVSEESFVEALVAMIVQDPNAYIVDSGQQESDEATVVGVGTGWVVTPDGHLVTAAHVVKGAQEELARSMAEQALQAASDAFVQGLSTGDTTLTPDQVERLTKVVLGWYADHLEVRDLKTSVAVLVGEKQGDGKTTRKVEAKVVEAGEVYPGNDVAVLKIDGVSNMPTMPLGTDDDVEVGSNLNIVGFPAASTIAPSFSPDTLAQPTVTQGPLTARKTTNAGMPVFQTQAPTSPGNSGGPVLAPDGAVIGVLVAGAVEDGQALEGQGYVIPVSEVTKMLSHNNVTPTTSQTTTVYNKALDDFYAKHYSDSRPQFDQTLRLYPQHPYVAGYQKKADAAIAAGKDESPTSLGVWLVVGALLILVLLAVVLVVVLLRRRKQRSLPRGQAQYAGWAPDQQQGYQPGQLQQSGYPGQPSGHQAQGYHDGSQGYAQQRYGQQGYGQQGGYQHQWQAPPNQQTQPHQQTQPQQPTQPEQWQPWPQGPDAQGRPGQTRPPQDGQPPHDPWQAR